MRVIGLTGSIGMGKSTTAAMFRAKGVPVHDSDAAVHQLYQEGAAAEIEAAFPGVGGDGAVDRALLAERVLGDPDALARLEAIVHPHVRQREAEFLAACAARGCHIAVVDVPLLFEAGRSGEVDAIVVVTADAKIQRARVLARRGMTKARFAAILARQTPDAEKRRRAHFLVDSGRGRPAADRQVDAILRALAAPV